MYRLTLTQNLSTYLPSSLPTPSIRRTYRWGNMWGILQNGEWRVEKRNQVQTEPYLLEEISVCNYQAPPSQIDDVWDEEVVQIDDTTYNGGMITVCLPGNILKQWCIRNNIPVSFEFKTTNYSTPVQVKQPNTAYSQSRPHSHSQTQSRPHSHSQTQSRPQSKQNYKVGNKQPICMIIDE